VKQWESDLVALHASKPPGTLTQTDIEQAVVTLGKTFPALDSDPEYTSFAKVLVNCRAFADTVIASAADPVQCRRRCLEALRQRREMAATQPRAAAVLDALFERLALPGWPDSERDKYRAAALVILHWRDYFVSYTRRGGAPFNKKFTEILEANLNPAPSAPQWQSDNLVAMLVHQVLRKQGLSGHFDVHSLRDGDRLDATIFSQLDQSFVLVQLLQLESFEPPTDGGLNWSYEEFKKFSQTVQSNGSWTRLTILVDAPKLEDIRPAQLDGGYAQEWYDPIKVEQTLWQGLSDLPKDRWELRDWSKKRALSILDRKKALVDALIDG
jgi:hypothetical protein